MASKNVKTVQTQFEGFNKHDLDQATHGYADEVRFTDHAGGVSLKTPQEIREHVGMFLGSASDAKITIREITDAGDTVALQLTFSGVNDGPFGPFPATGKHVSIEGANFFTFDKAGRIIGEDWYYDQLSTMVQLGHMQAPGI